MFILFVLRKIKELGNDRFYLDYDPKRNGSCAEIRTESCLCSAWIYFSVKTESGSSLILEETVVIDAYISRDIYVEWAKEYKSLPHTRVLNITVFNSQKCIDTQVKWSQSTPIVI